MGSTDDPGWRFLSPHDGQLKPPQRECFCISPTQLLMSRRISRISGKLTGGFDFFGVWRARRASASVGVPGKLRAEIIALDRRSDPLQWPSVLHPHDPPFADHV